MTINATLINLYHVCKRECWLHANGINMEHTSDTVYDGKLLHETSYPQRNEKHTELNIEAAYNNISLFGKIDFYDAGQKIIHETKRSDKVEKAHEWQVKFYLWLLKLNGIEEASAILEYPLLRQTDQLRLSAEDIEHLEKTIQSIAQLKESEECPPVINAKVCKSCSYYELCYINE
ncbi:CRISPR-associated protein Cas4 [Pedobacter sp. BS3]|uniref:CRISPR-associated protein Cas4 n=1 Tax=Pedobacter sp. BS3 TaxID=2567937 RepID=UPI0011EFBAF2|nr:CRISPR-associated protein Cas4 [Pedobacter sp. BS3]TZF81275.1 CRISPR-associated protein Cas4 [Pedobacter sp. BS3]